MDFESLIKILKRVQLRAHGLEPLKMISLFDDTQFFNIDYDIIPGPERNQIYQALTNNGWTAKSSRIFEKDSFRCGFARPSHTLGANPATNVVSSKAEFDCQFVTPTQALLFMEMEGQWNNELAYRLVFEQPANLDKMFQWLNEEKRDYNISKKALDLIQTNGIKKRKGEEHITLEDLLKEHL